MSNQKQKIIFLRIVSFCLIVGGFIMGSSVLAQTTTTLINPLKSEDIVTLIGQIIKFALGTFGAIALLMFIFGGFTWMTSMGDPKKVEQGMNTIKWAAIGIITAFSSYALIKFVFEMFGV